MTEHEPQLVMPFVSVTSKGGPHDDHAYTSGFAMGMLYQRLRVDRPYHHSETLRMDDVEQARVIANVCGYMMDHKWTGAERWVFADFVLIPPIPPALRAVPDP